MPFTQGGSADAGEWKAQSTLHTFIQNISTDPKVNEIYEVGKMKDKNEWRRSDDLPACEGSLG